MSEFEMVNIGDLVDGTNRGRRGRFYEQVKAALANPGKAILAVGAKTATQISQAKYARDAGVRVIQREGKIYIYHPGSNENSPND